MSNQGAPPPPEDEDWSELPEGWDVEDVSDADITAALDATRAAAAAAAPAPAPIVPAGGPPPKSWDIVAQKVKADTSAWIASARSAVGQLLVLRPSPGTGKTYAMIHSAVDERAAGRRVGYAVFAKEQLGETKDRFEQAMPGVRLHVLHGRDASNCDEWQIVEAAQKSGYAPGGTVCLKCPHYPKNQALPPCEYYRSRIRAAKDYNRARGAGTFYPIILTTHASMIQAQHLTEHEYGAFWSFDTIFFDEDPSAALEKIYEIGLPQLVYQHPQLADYHTWMTALLREAIYLAQAERVSASARLFKHPGGGDDHIHTRWGSAYVSDDLHDLLARAVNQPALASLSTLGIADAQTLITQTINSSSSSEPQPGEFAALPPQTIAKSYPHRGLVPICEALDAEMELLRVDRSNGMSNRFGYRVRLEYLPDQDRWQYVCVDYTVYEQEEPNIVIGDAYAHVRHYEALFQRVAEVVDHRAKWPAEALLVRNLCRASRRTIEDATTEQFFEQQLRPVLLGERGRSVLFYIHSKWKSDLEEWLMKAWDSFGLARYAIEHYGSGRGKDIYRDFNTMIAVSEFIPSMAGMVHEANGRAFLQTHYSDRFRVEHWQQGTASARSGWQTFANSTTSMDPRLLPIYQRKCVEELAQAIHRIRPSMPVRATDPPKRVFVFGQSIQLNEELLAATTPLSFDTTDDTGEAVYTLEPGSDETRGKLITLREGPVSFISAREMAQAIGLVYAYYGCWVSCFAHALLGLTFDGDFAQLQVALRRHADGDEDDSNIHTGPQLNYSLPRATAGSCINPSITPSFGLTDRVWSPPHVWETLSYRVCESRQYRTAYRLFLDALPVGVSRGTVRRPWMPSRSKGREYVGELSKVIAVIDQYAPDQKSKVPF